jgi:hypothetical protein
MPLLEVNHIRHINASVRLDESTAAQVDQYAAFIPASADDVVDKALNCVFLKDRDFQDFRRRHRLSRLPPHCVSVKARATVQRKSPQRSL